MNRISVLLADDNQTLLRLIADSLSRKPEIEIAGMAKDGVEALEMVQSACPGRAAAGHCDAASGRIPRRWNSLRGSTFQSART